MKMTKNKIIICIGFIAILLLLTVLINRYLEDKHIEDVYNEALELVLNEQYEEALSVLSVIELNDKNEYSKIAALIYLCSAYEEMETDNFQEAEYNINHCKRCDYPEEIKQKISIIELKVEVANNNKEVERRKHEAELERERRQKELEEKKTEQEFHYRPSSGSSDSNDKYDVYDVYDYDDPEDFYYDNVDDFESYEDAEDYWDDAQE